MENSTFILSYLLTILVCLIITVGLIFLISKGLKKYFENISQDNEIANFFIKITNVVIFLGGLSSALTSDYNTKEDSNWLTLIWDITKQLKESLEKLYLTLIVLAVIFFILHLVSRRTNK